MTAAPLWLTAAINAAAKARYEWDFGGGWDDLDLMQQSYWTDEVAAPIRAALPHILAGPFPRSVDDGWWPHYWSTYCIHDLHQDCRQTCKTCKSPCRCPCHTDEGKQP